MAPRDVNAEAVARRCDRLRGRFGDAPVRENRVEVPPEQFDDWVATSEAGYVGSAYALVRRPPEQLPALTESMSVDREERERVLLLLPRGGDAWGLPGGGQEDDEDYEATLRREVREEAGIEVEPDRLGSLRHDVATAEGREERLHTLRAFFHAEYVDGGIAVQPGEVNGAAWFADPPPSERLMPETERLLDDWRTAEGSSDNPRD